MGRLKRAVFRGLMAVCALATAFFTYFGVQLIYAVITFDGEGSLGHVGMFIAAGLFPLLALFFAGCTYLAWRSLRRHGSATAIASGSENDPEYLTSNIGE